ncbi:MAG: nucleotidyl transferase AbiEii/AbiGii toxin family protein [Rikenellaceae bacterium]|jgi:predicted nucleotidyltransferase component of viral defense system|nr:nucleotidyl transferase AbiEii/AbiGii toxin family protein [Rikenellaceae bacterium]
MISLEQIKGYFPAELRGNATYQKYMLKEYVQLMILDFLSTSSYIESLVFIGGTNLRLVKGIDRFSEDLDFDCNRFSQADFVQMTDDVLRFLQRSGFKAETRDKANTRLTVFRRNLYFPELLFELGLSGHKDERFLIKIESQDQGYAYPPVLAHIKRAGFFFPFPVPPDSILCAMKLSALLCRQKGRDFYDAMFLLGLTEPDYGYLGEKWNIHNKEELRAALIAVTDKTDLSTKSKDFEHLLFNKNNKAKIVRFREFVESL